VSTVLFLLGCATALVIILLLGNLAYRKTLGNSPQPPMESGLHFDSGIDASSSAMTIDNPVSCDAGVIASTVSCDGGGASGGSAY
jgi:hypothetical protein